MKPLFQKGLDFMQYVTCRFKICLKLVILLKRWCWGGVIDFLRGTKKRGTKFAFAGAAILSKIRKQLVIAVRLLISTGWLKQTLLFSPQLEVYTVLIMHSVLLSSSVSIICTYTYDVLVESSIVSWAFRYIRGKILLSDHVKLWTGEMEKPMPICNVINAIL